jgi:hypothetical protein
LSSPILSEFAVKCVTEFDKFLRVLEQQWKF